LPAGFLRGLLRFGKSELAHANWADPGGWRSMVISYDGKPRQWADRILVSGGAVSMALRNRLRLASSLLAELIDKAASESATKPIHVLCLGAGPGQVVVRAMELATSHSRATLVDINPDAFSFGRELAARRGLMERVSFICGDCRDVKTYLTEPPAIVKMLGICEYLTDRQIVDIASCAAAVMPAGSPIIFNNITRRHGNDRFLRRVFGLHMAYRTCDELCALMRTAGFDDFVIHNEPLGVYSVIVGHRARAPVAVTGGLAKAAGGMATLSGSVPAAAGLAGVAAVSPAIIADAVPTARAADIAPAAGTAPMATATGPVGTTATSAAGGPSSAGPPAGAPGTVGHG
jgi:predicted RNA methylase